MASLLAVPANEGMRSARLGGTGSLGHRRAPGACRPVGNGWFGYVAIAGRRPRSGASHLRASLSRPCASQQGWRRSVVWVSSEQPKRAAVAQLRQASLPVLRHVQWKHCRAARLPSSQPRARPPSRTSSSRAPCRRQFWGQYADGKERFSKNDCGFVELIPVPHHHAKGSSWAHSGGQWERFINTLGTEVVNKTSTRHACAASDKIKEVLQ